MPLERFLIGPPNSGLQQNLKPFLIMDDAWAQLANMYSWRGRMRKRFGTIYSSQGSLIADPLASRVKIQIGTYAVQTNPPGPAINPVPGTVFAVGQLFSVGADIFTVYQTGTPATMKSSNPNASGTYNTTTGAWAITYASGAPVGTTPVYWYPSTPIMGIETYQSAAINDNPTFVWDTQFSYQYVGGQWVQLGTAVWSGTDSNFFWSTNYRGSSAANAYMFTTNNNIPDGIKYWDGMAWNNMSISTGSGTTMQTALLIVPFHNRLVFLNTTEGGVNFPTRARYSAIGNPIENAGTSYFPWYSNPNAANWIGGGFEDNIQTQQPIRSLRFLRDRLIVFFGSGTESCWELVYTGNQILPFRWQQINGEQGSEATFSTIPFDDHILTFGNVGIHSCTGAQVQRIDDLIPN